MFLSLSHFNMVFRVYWEATLHRALTGWSTIFRWEIFSTNRVNTLIFLCDISFQNSLQPPHCRRSRYRSFLVTFRQTNPTGRSVSSSPNNFSTTPLDTFLSMLSRASLKIQWATYYQVCAIGSSTIYFLTPYVQSWA